MNCKRLAFLAKGFNHSRAIFTQVTVRTSGPSLLLQLVGVSEDVLDVAVCRLVPVPAGWSYFMLMSLMSSLHDKYGVIFRHSGGSVEPHAWIELLVIASLRLIACKGSPPSILPANQQ